MNIVVVLTVFVIVAAVIKICTDNIGLLIKPFYDLQRYKMIIAFFLTAPTILALNVGILGILKVPFEVSHSWFHYVDLILTILLLMGGAKSIHKLEEVWNERQKKTN